ncbi:MAG: C39 family peptidase [Candidatus Melainabacteria bacterium]
MTAPVVPPLRQTHNGCGTTCLAMVLQAFHRPVAPGEIDRRMRRWPWLYSDLHSLAQMARHVGCGVVFSNHNTRQTVQSHLAAGRLLIALLDERAPGAPLMLHYVVIHGLSNHRVRYCDPFEGKTREEAWEAFSRRWAAIRVLAIPTGLCRFALVLSATPDRPDAPERLGWYARLVLRLSQFTVRLLNAMAVVMPDRGDDC